MATRKAKAVFKVNSPYEYKIILPKSTSSINKLRLNVSIFNNPNPTLEEMETQVDVLQNYIDLVNGGDHSYIGMRNEATALLYRMNQQQLIYVNQVANGNVGILELSGYDISDEPNPRPIPDQVIIKKIVPGKTAKTAKIFIVSMEQVRLNFIVQMTTTPELEDSWKQILLKSNSNNIIISDLIHGQEVWFRVCAYNPAGTGLWSVPVSFICQN
ncbi:MAG: fibronectin type III domain-containing protein [Bacteroidales bacterium]|nr:fibronectin type III domain-containing protein [Bacteroidales bacterium]